MANDTNLEKGQKPQKEEEKDKNITIPKSKLDEVLGLLKKQGKEIEELRSRGVEQTPRIAKKIKDYYCNLRRYQGEIVVDFASQIYNEWDERKREFVLYFDLKLQSGKVVKKVKYLDFVSNSEKVKVKILKESFEEKSTVEAMIQQKEPEGEFGTIITDVLVPVESIEKVFTYTVELEGGETLELNQSAINI